MIVEDFFDLLVRACVGLLGFFDDDEAPVEQVPELSDGAGDFIGHFHLPVWNGRKRG